MKRRDFVTRSTIGAAGLVTTSSLGKSLNANKDFELKNNIHHSVCQWCYGYLPIEDFLVILKDLGIKSIDLVSPKDWSAFAKV